MTFGLVCRTPTRDFYDRVLGAKIYREYGGTSCVLNFLDSWLLLVTPGGPTPDKPGVTFEPPVDTFNVPHAMTIRVPDCHTAHKTLSERGAEFLTPPVERETEIRCFFRDPKAGRPRDQEAGQSTLNSTGRDRRSMRLEV